MSTRGFEIDTDKPVADEVIAKLWPEPETRPAWARRCRYCHLIYTSGSHDFECPELGYLRPRQAGTP